MLLNTLLLSACLLGANPTEVEPTPTEPEIVEPGEGEQTPSKPDINLEDNNNDGIPDKWADYYDKHIKDDYMFGISLGALIGVVGTIATTIYSIIKTKKTQKLLAQDNLDNKKVIEELNKRDEEKEKRLAEYQASQQLLLQEYEKATKELINSLDRNVDLLTSYSTIDIKLNTCIDLFSCIAKDENLIRQGISEEIDEKISGVK